MPEPERLSLDPQSRVFPNEREAEEAVLRESRLANEAVRPAWMAGLKPILTILEVSLSNLEPIKNDPTMGWREKDEIRARKIKARIPRGKGIIEINIHEQEHRQDLQAEWQFDRLFVSTLRGVFGTETIEMDMRPIDARTVMIRGENGETERQGLISVGKPHLWVWAAIGSRKRIEKLDTVGLAIPQIKYTKPEQAVPGICFVVNEVARELKGKKIEVKLA